MSILDTRRGQEWLAQFDPLDIDAAIRLVTALELVPSREIEAALLHLLEGLATRLTLPIALFAARELGVGELRQLPGHHYLGSVDNKSFHPPAVGPGHDVGSEGRIAQLIGNLRVRNRVFLDHPSLTQMAKRKVRHIVLVDDFIASGKRISSFLAHLYEHPTVKSWVSLKYVAFSAVAYSATEAGSKRLQRCRPPLHVEFHRGCPTFDRQRWSDAERRAVSGICHKYAERVHVVDRPHALGYRNSQALMVLEYNCPNNVPAIVWSRSPRWSPLFPRRMIPTDLLPEFMAPSEYQSISARLVRLGQHRLSQNPDLIGFGDTARKLVLFLSAVSRRFRRYVHLSTVTGLSVSECRSLRTQCLQWGLISSENVLTEAGRTELARLRSKGPLFPPVDSSDEPYYPQSLRRP